MPIEAIPRSPVIGMIADLLRGAKGIAKSGKEGVSAPGQAAGHLFDFLLGDRDRILDDASYGFYPWSSEKRAKEAALEFGGDIPGPGTLVKGVKAVSAPVKALAESLLTKEGLGGLSLAALFPGGRKDLIATHASSLKGLVEGHSHRGPWPAVEDMKVLDELYSPSLAISPPNTVSRHFAGEGRDNVIFVAKEGAFDPRTGAATDIVNRDAWLPRREQYEGANRKAAMEHWKETGLPIPPQFAKETAKMRLAERFGGYDPFGPKGMKQPFRLGEDPDFTNEISHQAAIHQSPHFASFADFEGSKKGAALLTPSKSKVRDWGEDFTEDFFSDPGISKLYDDILNAKARGDHREADQLEAILNDWTKSRERLSYKEHYLRSAHKAPSEYAEVKVHGPVQTTGENWAGAINLPKAGREALSFITGATDFGATPASMALARDLAERGVPVATPIQGGRATPSQLFELALLLQEQAKSFGRTPLP